jgi:probable F420-dependent oxidoreductase
MDFGIASFLTDEGIRPDVLAKAIEDRGFTTLSIAEHSHVPASRESPYPGGGEMPRVYYRTFDPFVALTAAATATTTLRVGTGIALLIQRDLFHTAKEVASLDVLSGGRFEFGVGVGWNREEMSNHGTDPTKRGALLNEQLAALKEIWTKDEAEFHGKQVDFDPVYAWPKPVQKPHPPIFIGGESEAALNRLAEHGNGWLPRVGTPPEELNRVRKWLADRGRTDVKFTVWGGSTDPGPLAGYAEGGVEQVDFFLPTLGEDDTLRKLDELAEFAGKHR